MKTKKLSYLIMNFALVCALIFGTCFGFFNQVANQIAFAIYEAQDYLSESAHETYDFEKNTGWLAQTNYYNQPDPSDSSATINAFAGSATGIDLTTFLGVTGLSVPSIRFDGSSLSGPADDPDCDNYVLAILANNAPTTQNQKDGDGNFVYADDDTDKTTPLTEDVYYRFQSSNTLNFTKNNYYAISFWIYTEGTATASFRISGDLTYETTTLQSPGTWSQFYIFVASHADANDTVNFHLQYGNEQTIYTQDGEQESITGYVLFDNLHIDQISETDFLQKTINGEELTQTNFTYSPRKYITTDIDSDFQGDLSIYKFFEEQEGFDSTLADAQNWYYYAPEDINNYVIGNYQTAYNATENGSPLYFNASTVLESEEFKTTGTDGTDTSAPSTFNPNNKVLKLENYSSVLNLGLVSKTFTVEQFGLYRVSIMLKAKDKNAKATIMAISSIPTGNDSEADGGTTFSGTSSVSAFAEDSDFTNDWVEATLYIRGNAFRDLQTRLVILAEAGSTIYVDHIQIERITTTNYSNNTDSNKLDLSPTSVLQNTNITNGFFNFVNISELEDGVSYPLTPSSWTTNDTNYDEEDIVSGVITTREDIYDAHIKPKIGDVENPLSASSQKINVLAIYAKQKTDLSGSEDKTLEFYYENSSTFSVSSSNIVKITFDVYTARSETSGNFTGNVIARLIYNSTVITDFVTNYQTQGSGTWETYTIYVRTGAASKSLKLDLGISDAQGTVFFRNVKYTALSEKTVDDEKISVNKQYDEILAENNTWEKQVANKIRFVDFLSDSGTTHTSTPIDGQNYYQSHIYTVDEVNDGDTVLSGDMFIANTSTGFTFGDTTLTSADLEREGSKTDTVLVLYNDSEKYSLANPIASSTLAKDGFYKLSVWVKTSESVGDNFNIIFKNVNTTFSKVNTSNVTENNGYCEYVAYVKTGSSAISAVEIQFELGTSENKVAGYALISDISIDTLDEETFNSETENLTGNEANIKVNDFSSSASSSTSSGDDLDDNTQLIIFFAVFSSLLLVIAIVIAVFSYGLRRFRKQNAIVGENQANVNTKPTNKNDAPKKDGFV